MGTTREEVEGWVDAGLNSGATHVIVFCDTFSYEDYPVFVQPGQDVDQVRREHLRNTDMCRTMEVIDLAAMRVVRGKAKQVEALLGPAEPPPAVEDDRFPSDLGAEVSKL